MTQRGEMNLVGVDHFGVVLGDFRPVEHIRQRVVRQHLAEGCVETP